MDLIELLQQNIFYIAGFLFFIWIIKTPILARLYHLEYISLQDAFDSYRKQNPQPLFLDIRTQWEIDNEPRIKKSKSVPLSELSYRIDELKQQFGLDKKIIIVCRSGSRAKIAGIKLKRAGFTDVTIMQGGIMKWHRADYPVIIPKPKRSFG